MRVRLRNPDREVELAGGRTIHDVLGELEIDPDTVLVIRERELLTREDRVGDADVIEIRPVISGGARTENRMKCRRCKAPAVVEIRRHNAAFCGDCFLRHVREQVKRAIASYDMFEPSDRILVAVSGGKDSLALWDVLLQLGYHADGLYLGLGSAGTRIGRTRWPDRSLQSATPTSARSTWRATTGSTCQPQARRAPDRPAPSADYRSATSSTGRPATASMT